MITIIQAIILGIIQGVTEWLPISSSGHLVLIQNLFNFHPPVIFDIILHLGSLIVICIVFWKDIIILVKDILKLKVGALKYLFYMFLASIPIAIIGIFFNDAIKSIFNSSLTVGISLIFTSIFLFLTKYAKDKNEKLNIKNTFIMGIAQAFAILPGVSRSGMAISAGILQGAKRQDTARFAFLIFVPAILGATLFEINNITAINNIPALIIGTIASIIAGVLSLKLLLNIIQKAKFHYFGWYCLVLGIIITIISL